MKKEKKVLILKKAVLEKEVIEELEIQIRKKNLTKKNTTDEVKVQNQKDPMKIKSIIEEEEAHLEIKPKTGIIIGILIDKDTLKE